MNDHTDRIIREVLAIQAHQRYGAWTNPVMTGMLLALDLLKEGEAT